MKIIIDTSCDAKKTLSVELKLKDMTREQLAEALTEMAGKKVTKASVNNKLSRGNFSANFFLQALTAIAKKG